MIIAGKILRERASSGVSLFEQFFDGHRQGFGGWGWSWGWVWDRPRSHCQNTRGSKSLKNPWPSSASSPARIQQVNQTLSIINVLLDGEREKKAWRRGQQRRDEKMSKLLNFSWMMKRSVERTWNMGSERKKILKKLITQITFAY